MIRRHFDRGFVGRLGRMAKDAGSRERTTGLYLRRLTLEPLEDRRLLSSSSTPGNEAVELFRISPALFVENQGQWADEAVRFVHQGDGANVAMTDAGPVFQLYRSEPKEDAAAAQEFQTLAAAAENHVSACEPYGPVEAVEGEAVGVPDVPDEFPGFPDDRPGPEDFETTMLEFSAGFVGANTVVPVGLDQAETTFNYFLGDESNWQSAVPSYEAVAYEGLYDGIDLHTWGQRSHLKYEFHVARGADYRQIQIRYDGIEGLQVADDGSLHVALGEGWDELIDDAPYIYQVIDGQQVEVAGRFVVLDEFSYTFEITGAYDPNRELVVDPDLAWSTYLGGSSSDDAEGIATDAAGNVLVTGQTYSSGWVSGGFDTSLGGDHDAFVAKLSPAGDHLWSTYLGGDTDDWGHGIATDAAGNVLVTGDTYSSSSGWVSGGFDTSYNGGNDAFVAKLSPAGGHIWSTYLGGSSGDGGYAIATDAAGNVLVTGSTDSSGWVSSGFDTSFNGGEDAFVAKLSPAGGHLWSTYLGGSGGEAGNAIATDAAGNVLVTSYTLSSGWVSGGFDTSFNGGRYDAFVAKLSSAGGHLWSTYLGGSSDDYGYGIANDAAGNVLVTGYTLSSGWVSGGFDASHNGGMDAFVAKLSPAGGHLWTTYLGGSGDDRGWRIATDAAGNVLVTGDTYSSGWVSGGFDTSFNGGLYDAFVAKLSSAGGHLWSTYLGGSNDDHGLGIATDAAGNVLVTGHTYSSGWVSGGFDTSFNGRRDAFVAKIGGAGVPIVDTLFEVLARGVAYDDWSVNQEVIFDGADLGYAVDRVFQDATGFYGLGLLSDLYGPALVLRGTEPWADWFIDPWEDSDPRGVGYEQFIANWKAPQKYDAYDWLTTLGEPADIVGHSLGGALAQWIAAAFASGGGRIDELVTFNSPGISNDRVKHPGLLTYADRFVPGNATSVTHYVVNGDVVSLAGEAFLAGEVQMASFSDLNVINKHVLPLLVPSVGDRQRPSDISLQPYSVDALSSATYGHTDRDHQLWVTGLDVALRSKAVSQPSVLPLTPVSGMLMSRGTTEYLRSAPRRLIGEALRTVQYGIEGAEAAFEWTKDAAGKFVLKIREGAHDLYESVRMTVDPNFNLTVDGGDPPAIRVDGGLSLDVGNAIDFDLPAWLGGSFTADHLIELADMDYGGVMDRDHLAVNGQLALLGGLMDVNGAASLDRRRGELSVGGAVDILDGFITANGTAQVGANLDLMMRGGASVQIPDSVPWIGGTPIASGNFLLNYVNDSTLVNDFVAGWGSLGPVELGLRVWLDGRWDVLGAKEINSLEQKGVATIVAAGATESAAKGASYSESYSIQPGTDWVLFMAEWENPSTTAALQLQTPSGQVLTEADIEADPSMTIVTELTNDHRKVVRVDGPDAGTWTATLADTTGLGSVNMTAMITDSLPSVSVVSVSDGLLRQPVQIAVAAYDADSEARVALFYDTDAEGFDGVMIADGLVEADGVIDYVWDTEGVAAGEYYLYARIIDDVNPPVFDYAESPMQITDWAWVAERQVFYNNSYFDDPSNNATFSDDTAIASDKWALLPDKTATFVNYTSSDKGINGIMVDIAELPLEALTAADFGFMVGNSGDLANWTPAPEPLAIDVLPGMGTGDSDRVTIIWPDGAIRNQWLQVVVRATENTGLLDDDVFYFGNAVGEAGNAAGNAIVNATDEIMARNFPHGASNLAAISDPYDYNRDRLVNGTDQIIARGNQTNPLSMLRLITAPAVEAGTKQAAEQSAVTDSDPLGPSAAELNWLYELQQSSTRTAKKARCARNAVDQLLASYW